MSGFIGTAVGVALGGANDLTVAGAVNTGLGLLGIGHPTVPGIPYAWRGSLQQASWRGVPFAVTETEIKRGRRTAIHEYPQAEDPASTVWVEDLGMGVRTVTMTGFIVGDNVTSQWNALLAAFEVPDSGQLVHPSLGAMTVSMVDFSSHDNVEAGRVVSFRATFIEGATESPVATVASGFAAAGAAFGLASQAQFVLDAGADLLAGLF